MHLEISGLDKHFKSNKGSVTALKGLTLHVEEGEFVCVVGASGSGKSTLLRLIAGLEQPSAGHIVVDYEAITGPGADRGLVFQDYTLYPWMTVQKNVEFGLKLQGVSSLQRRDQASYYIDMVGLSDFARALPKQLSGGMKQRVAIARALTSQPKILLLDEPFGALDIQTKESMQQFLLDLWQRTGISILMITHDVREAVFLAQRIYVMTARPGTIRAEIPIKLGRDRTAATRKDPSFKRYQDWVSGLLSAPRVPAVSTAVEEETNGRSPAAEYFLYGSREDDQ
ncbi:MAG: ABC transporter ATP-binding protein [Phormidesmis sp.]